MSSSEKVLKATIKLVDNFTKPMERATQRTRELETRHRKLAKALGKPLNFAFRLDSKVFSYLNKIKTQYTRLKTSFKDYIRVKIEANKAIATINILKRHFSALKNLKSFKAMVSLKDKISGTLSKLVGKLKSFVKKPYDAMVKVKDKASSVLSSIKGKLSSLAAGVTIGVAVKSAVGGAMDLQQNQTSIRHFMGVGNAGKDKNSLDSMANNYSSWLVNNANLTPFSTAEVMAGGAKALTATGGNVAKAQEMIKRAEDMAGLMGKPLEQAIDALMDIELGQYARLTEFGISAEGGANGESPEEVLKEIDRRFGGGAEKLSQSAKGKLSTMTGKFMSGLSQVGTAFLPGLSTAFDSISGLIDSVAPKLAEFAGNIAKAFEAFAQSEQASQYLQIFKTVGSVVFDAIGKVIETCRPFVEKVFNFIASKAPEISNIIEGLGAIWDMVWSTVGPLLETAWAIVKPILSWLIDKLSELSDFIQKVGEWWTDMVDKIKNNPIVAKVSQVWDKATGKSEGRNAFGSGRIARDGTVRTLHQGEKVLTRTEADAYSRGQNNAGVVVNISGLTVREESDINKIASQLLKKINENKIVYGGAY